MKIPGLAYKTTSMAEDVRHEGSLDPIIDTNKRQPSVVTETKMNPKIT